MERCLSGAGAEWTDSPMSCFCSCSLVMANLEFLCPSATACLNSLVSFASRSLFSACFCISWVDCEKQRIISDVYTFTSCHLALSAPSIQRDSGMMLVKSQSIQSKLQ